MAIFKGKMTESSETIKLDLKDRRIIYELGKNGRFSFSRIAKATGLSRENVAYRIKRLEDIGFYVGTTALIDPTRFGWLKHAIYLQLQHHTKEEEQKLLDQFVSHSDIICVTLCNGNYDIGLLTVSKCKESFYHLFNEILTLCGNHLSDYLVLDFVKEDFLGIKIMFDNEKLPEEAKMRPDHIAFETEFLEANPARKNVEIDDIDRKILNELALDGRIELVKLADKANVPVENARERISRLINERVIFRFMALGSSSLIGYSFYETFLRLKNLTPEKEKELIRYFEKHPNILWYVKTIGRWSILLNVFVRNSVQYKRVIDGLRTTFPDIITDFNTIEVLGQLKNITQIK